MKFLSRIEQKTGDLYADCFKVLDEEQWHFQGQLLAEQLGITQRIVLGKVCLDAGCGHGSLTYQLLQLGAKEVYGVDLKPAPKQGAFDRFGNVSFVQASLLDLPFENNFFDVVVCTGVLHHTLNPEKGFAEMTRVLKPGGRFVLGVYGKHGLFPYCLALARFFTVTLPIVPEKLVSKLAELLRLNPIWRYQVLDYLYVPILRRYSPAQVKEMFLKYNFDEPVRLPNLTPERAQYFVSHHTSYSYDYTKLKSKILFGHGFIVVAGTKK
ncbi:TPA: hypothetical protein DCP81_00210 [Candidatus Azambacteria bacterium]|nr:hypothetical protein [Candidatus Azambacteria bacterium]